jgi:hypothetical protein
MIHNGTMYNRTAEIWQEGFKLPFKEESFSQSLPLTEIVEWANNFINTNF